LIQAYAAETVFAAKAVLAKLDFGAVAAILAIIGHVTVYAINAFRAPLAVHAEG